jgi:hypothetical protein
MAEIINLRIARKRQARAQEEAKAATNRALHGRTRQEKLAQRAEQARADRQLDGAKIDPD